MSDEPATPAPTGPETPVPTTPPAARAPRPAGLSREVRLGPIPAIYGIVVTLYAMAIVGAFAVAEWMLASGNVAALAAGLVAPLVGAGTGTLVLVFAVLTLWRATRLQQGTRGRARLSVMGVSGLTHALAFGAAFAASLFLAGRAAPSPFGGPIDPRELLLPLSRPAEIGLYVASATFVLTLLVLLGSTASAWFLAPNGFRRMFWIVADGLLAMAFVPVALGFAILHGWLEWHDAAGTGGATASHGIAPGVVHHLLGIREPGTIPLDLQGAALVVAVLFAIRASARLLPPALGAIERFGFSPLVAARHLRAKKSNFLTVIGVLSVLAVALSSCALTTTLSVMGGFRNDLKQKILGNNAHVVVDVEHGTFGDWRSVVHTARTTHGVRGAAPYVSGEVMVTSASNLAGAVLRGIDPSRASNVIDLEHNLVRGRLEYLEHPERLLDLPPDEALGPYPMDIPTLHLDDDEQAGPAPDNPSILDPLPDDPTSDQLVELLGSPTPIDAPREVLPGIIVGQELARSLRLYVGDEVNVVSPLGDLGPAGPMPKSRPFRVAGIFYSGMYEYDMKYTYVVLQTAQRFLNVGNEISGVEVKVADVEHAPDVAASLRHTLADAGRDELRVQDWQEVNSTLFGALELERLAMFIFLGIAILVAGFCVFGTLTLMVQEKSGETGILKAMGARGRDVVSLFLLEGFLIGILGAALGLGLGYVACFAAEHFGIRMNPEVYYIDKLPVHIDASEFGLVGLASVVVCVVATIFPAVLASEVRPVDALRYE